MLSGYTVLQLSLQAANALTGFMLIRSMDKMNYAWFTVAFGSQTMISVLADCGLTSSLTTLGGPICREPARLSALVELIRRWRLKFMIASFVVILPATWWMLQKNSASFSQVVAVLILIVLTGYAAIDTAVLIAAKKLSGNLPTILMAESLFSVIRLGFVAVLFAIGGSAITALICSVVAYACELLFLRFHTVRHHETSNESDPSWVPAIRSQVRHVLPIGIWHCVQGQISTLVLTMFATTGRVAEIGALSRFGFVFVVMMLPLGHFLLPAIARCVDRVRLRKLINATLASFAISLFVLVLIGNFCSSYCLLLLGPNYQHLEVEFVWYLAATSLATIGHVVWGIALTRGWVHFGWLEIPLTVALQAASAPLLDFSRISSVIAFVSLGSLVHLIVGIALLVKGFRHGSTAAPTWKQYDVEISEA